MTGKPVRFLNRGDAGQRLAETGAREGLSHSGSAVGGDLSQEK
jgi:hypothetical protein